MTLQQLKKIGAKVQKHNSLLSCVTQSTAECEQ